MKKLKLPKFKKFKINRKTYLILVISLFLILFEILYLYLIGVNATFTGDRSYEIRAIKGTVEKTCTTDCTIRLPLGTYSLLVSKDDYLNESKTIKISLFKNKTFEVALKPMPQFFFERQTTHTDITQYGWIGDEPVYKHENKLVNLLDKSVVMILPNEKGTLLWDRTGQLVGYLDGNMFWTYDGTRDLIKREVSQFLATGSAVENHYAFVFNNEIRIHSLNSGKLVQTIKPQTEETFKDVLLLEKDILAIQISEKNKNKIVIKSLGEMFEDSTIYETSTEISDLEASLDNKYLSVLTKEALVMIPNLAIFEGDQKETIIETSPEYTARKHLWISNTDIILFEKVFDYRTIDNVIRINTGTKEKKLIATSIELVRRIDYSTGFAFSPWENQIIIKENNAMLWLIKLDHEDIPNYIWEANQYEPE